MAFAESRIRAETIAAEDILHDMGAISIVSSDSQVRVFSSCSNKSGWEGALLEGLAWIGWLANPLFRTGDQKIFGLEVTVDIHRRLVYEKVVASRILDK